MNLKGADFTGAVLNNVVFDRCSLTDAVFANATLRNVELRSTQLDDHFRFRNITRVESVAESIVLNRDNDRTSRVSGSALKLVLESPGDIQLAEQIASQWERGVHTEKAPFGYRLQTAFNRELSGCGSGGPISYRSGTGRKFYRGRRRKWSVVVSS